MKFVLCVVLLSSATLAQATLMEAMSLPIDQRVKQLESQKPQSYAFLRELANDKRAGLTTRWRAVTTMGRINANEFRQDLERALRSQEWFMRNAALIALQTDDRDQAVQWSARLLSDPALVVRTQAVRNLIQLGARETEAVLWRQIFAAQNFRGRESLWVRVHMAEALAKFSTQGHVRDFQRLLLDPDRRLHTWAILGLENSTGLKLGDKNVPLEIRRRQWLERLGASSQI
jgi:HEAT repeat protein